MRQKVTIIGVTVFENAVAPFNYKGMNKFMDIDFYFVKSDYIKFLKKAEIDSRGFTCVPNTEYASREKFLFGAVFEYKGINYFVPVSSKIKNADNNIIMKSGKNNSVVLGTLRFAYMIPVPNKCLIKLEINDVPEESRRRKIRSELAFCRRNIHKIKLQAQKTFNAITNSTNKKLQNNSCDFLILQNAYITYCLENNIELPKQLQTDNNLPQENKIQKTSSNFQQPFYPLGRSIIKKNSEIISSKEQKEKHLTTKSNNHSHNDIE